MKQIPSDLNSDISSLPDPRERGQVRQLTYAVIVLAGVVGVLFSIILSNNKTSKGDKDTIIRELKADIRNRDSIINVQSASLTNCLSKQIYDAHQSILREQKFNEEQIRSTKRQDSLLALLNKSR